MDEEADIIKQLAKPARRSLAFSNLVRLYQERLYFHIRKMLVSHDDTNDVLQNTFLKAWNNIDQFRGDSKLITWLYKIATNETLTFMSQKKNKFAESIDEVDSSLLNALHADQYFDGNHAEMKLQEAILSLPEKQRLVFNMKYFEDFTYDELQVILETSAGALKASYHHAVKKIEKYLKDEEFSYVLKDKIAVDE